jgi:hypothetical protein
VSFPLTRNLPGSNRPTTSGNGPPFRKGPPAVPRTGY